MGRQEVERAYLQHRARVSTMVRTGDWRGFADAFTPEASYQRPGHARLEGREAIRSWVVDQMTTWPATEIVALDHTWHTVDAERESVVFEVRTTLRDPGDGSIHQASTTTSMGYGGDGQWAWAMDMANPEAYLTMWRTWTRIAREHGTVAPAGPVLPGADAQQVA